MPFHWLTFQLSVAFTDYHTLPVSVSYRDLTRMTAPYKLFPRTNCVELFSSAYKPSIVLATRAVLRQVRLAAARQVGCVTSPCLLVLPWKRCRAAVWRHRSCAEKQRSVRFCSERHGTQETSYVVVPSLAAWRADCCLATRNNIHNSIVACVYSVAGCVT
jgi:hypothetical protein